MPTTIRDVLRDAAIEVGALSQSEPQQAGDAQYLLGRLNRILDAWTATHENLYADQAVEYTLTPNLVPHTIGPAPATWVMAARPVSIESAMLVLPVGNAYEPIRLRDAQWYYAGQQVPMLESQYPTDLYYEPAWPLGILQFWPIPTAAYNVQLQIRRVLSAVTYDDVFSMPPGYQDALTLSLAEAACRGLGRDLSPVLVQQAALARHRVFVNNVSVPPIATQDYGMPSGAESPNLPTWNYLIGS